MKWSELEPGTLTTHATSGAAYIFLSTLEQNKALWLDLDLNEVKIYNFWPHSDMSSVWELF